MVSNPHRAIVLKMSNVSASVILMHLDAALNFYRAFYGSDSYYFVSCSALCDIVRSAVRSYNSKQIVIDVKLPSASDFRD